MIYITSLKDAFFWRQNTGAVNIGDRFVRFGIPGAPDIQGILKGRFVGIEVKNLKGKVRESQEKWKNACLRGGGIYIVARSVGQVKEVLEENGLL